MFWEVRRKDFLEMFAHHIVTLALITYSYSLGCAGNRGRALCHGVQESDRETLLVSLCNNQRPV